MPDPDEYGRMGVPEQGGDENERKTEAANRACRKHAPTGPPGNK